MTSTETRRTWSERFNPRNWTLVWKLAVVGLLPALLALVLGVLRVADQAGDAADLTISTRLLEVQKQVDEASNALREERDESVLFVATGRIGETGPLEITGQATDAEVEQMLNALRAAAELDPTTISATQIAQNLFATMSTVRQDALQVREVSLQTVRENYDEIVDSVDTIDRALLRQLRTPETAGLADALNAVNGTIEELSIQHTVIGTAIRQGESGGVDDKAVVDLGSSKLATNAALYRSALTLDQLTAFGDFASEPANQLRDRLRTGIAAQPPNSPVSGISIEEWDKAYVDSRDAAQKSADLLRAELVARSTAAENAASNEAGIQSVILMLGLLAGITVAVLVARSLIRSLRVLRTAALDVAERRLPQAVESMRAGETPDVTVEPVPLTTGDEVGQVARAFDAVHGQAVRLAAEQAALQSNVSAMFVNLSRRSQALVERQLQLIEQLESNEQDPDQLSNLFQLDHLATRMRRNSENLLVLAGTDLAKRNAAPIPLVDVLRAAVSEVEQYQRVVVQSPPTATVAGRAGADLVHLLAELLDNATNFSPPDSQVVMSSTRTPDGSIMVEISDRGVGMADHELMDANQRLGGPSSVDVSASRRMGLFVVGRLGARHGVAVRLGTSGGPGQAGGLTASVTVPAYLVTSSPATAGARQFGGGGMGQGEGSGLPQRASNGSGPNGSLSALVTGSDGPSNPTSVFDAQVGDGNSLGGPPAPANGTPNLPTRRPGSTLRPGRDGPPLAPNGPGKNDSGRPEPARPEPDRAREIAEQARRDQEAAARRTAQQNSGSFPAVDPHQADDRFGSGFFQNGNGSTQTGAPAGPGQDRGPQGPQARTDSGRGDQGRDHGRDSGRGEGPDQRGGEPTGGPGTDAGGQRGAFGQPLPQRVPGSSPHRGRPQPFGDEIEPTARNRQDESGRPPQPARPQTGPHELPPTDRQQLPELPQRMPPSELPQREPGANRRTDSHQFGSSIERTHQVPPVDRSDPALQPPTQQPPTPERSTAGEQPAQPAAPSDELFAPVVPAEPQPDGPPPGRRPGTPAAGPAAPASTGATARRIDPTETTPIFEEIASAWFRSNRQIPVDYAEQSSPGVEPAAQPPAARPSTPAPTATTPPIAPPPPAPQQERQPVQQDRPAPAPSPVQRPATTEPAQPERTGEPVGASARGDNGFATEADDGWRAASGAVTDRSSELTTAGLPKRRPRARLVPGSAGSAVLAAPASPARSAENIRGRLASYQQGVRQGRERRLRGETATPNGSGSNGGHDPASAGGNHDEESS